MRINRSKTAIIALATAGLLALGTVAYAEDGNEISLGGHSESTSTADNSGSNVTSGGNNTSNSGDGGDVNTNSTDCGGGGSGSTGNGLINIGDVNLCPVVNVPVLSPTKGGDASGGDNESNSNQVAQSSSSSSADGKSSGDSHSHSNKAKKKGKKKAAPKKLVPLSYGTASPENMRDVHWHLAKRPDESPAVRVSSGCMRQPVVQAACYYSCRGKVFRSNT